MYKLKLLDGNMSIRADHTVTSDKISQLEVTEVHEGDYVWNCLVDGEFLNAKAGDEWLHLVTPVVGWVAVKHAGRIYCELINLNPDPPEDVTLKHVIDVYSDGSLRIDGSLFP